MIVYFSTVVRQAPPDRGGELVKLDWSTKRVCGRAPMAAGNPAVYDPNPRGSTRGGRGILLDQGKVFAASYHTVHMFDQDLRPCGALSNHLFAGLHELCWDDGCIWTAATDVDAAIKVDRGGQIVDQWWPREDAQLVRKFQLPPLDIDKTADNRGRHVGVGNAVPGHVHLNAMAMLHGRPLVLLNRYGCVVRLRPTEIFVEDRTLKGAHNLLVTPDHRVMINDTVNRNVRMYDDEGKPTGRIDLRGLAPVRRILRRHQLRDVGVWLARNGRPARVFGRLFGGLLAARPIFVRGLASTNYRTLLVGISPAAILEIDLDRMELVDFFVYSRDVHCCVHGLVCDTAPASSPCRHPSAGRLEVSKSTV